MKKKVCSPSPQVRLTLVVRQLKAAQALGIFQRILICFEDALLDELLGIWSALKPLFEVVSPHVVFELPLLLLQSRRSVRGWQNVSLDEVVAVRAGIEPFPKVVGRALAFELESFGLKSAVEWSIKDV